MTGLDLSLVWMLIAVLLSAAISVAVLLAVTGFRRNASQGAAPSLEHSVFLLRDDQIIDQTIAQNGHQSLNTWRDLRAWLGDRFCGVPDELTEDGSGTPHEYRPVAVNDEALLTIRHTPQGYAVTLEDKTVHCASDRHALLLENKQAGSLQHVLEQAPAVVFAISDEGILTWGNARFERLSVEDRCVFLQAARDRGKKTKLELCLEDAMSRGKQHFELSVLPGQDSTVIYASDVTRLVEADSVRHEFVQTLTKTFADLSTGLAVFDRDHRLVLFNPAVMDLTDLSAEFLIARPEMIEFFDRLRDNHVMPEPKNYASWRGQITEMIKSAANGHYSESWSLPGGMTYKLTGRPHPNGAIAFLIEDITDEMALTRQSRSQLETHQAILDAMQDAVAVIGPDGGLLISNAAFAQVVGFDPDASITRTSFQEVVQAFRSQFPGNQVWDDLSKNGMIPTADANLRDTRGSKVRFRIEPLPEGLFMLNLSSPAPQVPLPA